jgi:hypothetical protein
MDGRVIAGRMLPLNWRIGHRERRDEAASQNETVNFFRVLRQIEAGEWDLVAWADELGVSEDEMLIEIDRHLHGPVAA